MMPKKEADWLFADMNLRFNVEIKILLPNEDNCSHAHFFMY